MKKTGLVLSLLLLSLPILSYAQTAQTTPPDSWTAFQQQENDKRKAFYDQLRSDREVFLAAHPEVKAYLDNMRATAKARFAAWKAAHPKQ